MQRQQRPAKNKNAGLVGPAQFIVLHSWGVDWFTSSPADIKFSC
jgi:hypothetical protein